MEHLVDLLGLRSEQGLSAMQMCVRAMVSYLATILIIRMGNRRFIGRNTVFDLVLGFILGSIVSRGITGNAPLIPVLCVSATLVALHWIFGALAFYFEPFRKIVEGSPRELVLNGEINWSNMKQSHITEEDLAAALREHSEVSLSNVTRLTLERNGKISILKRREGKS